MRWAILFSTVFLDLISSASRGKLCISDTPPIGNMAGDKRHFSFILSFVSISAAIEGRNVSLNFNGLYLFKLCFAGRFESVSRARLSLVGLHVEHQATHRCGRSSIRGECRGSAARDEYADAVHDAPAPIRKYAPPPPNLSAHD